MGAVASSCLDSSAFGFVNDKDREKGKLKLAASPPLHSMPQPPSLTSPWKANQVRDRARDRPVAAPSPSSSAAAVAASRMKSPYSRPSNPASTFHSRFSFSPSDLQTHSSHTPTHKQKSQFKQQNSSHIPSQTPQPFSPFSLSPSASAPFASASSSSGFSSSPSRPHLHVDPRSECVEADPPIERNYRQEWLNSTPRTSGLARKFPFYDPICMRYFSSIYVTSCCGNSICLECTERYIASRAPAYLPLSFIPVIPLQLACPHCAQNVAGVAFKLIKANSLTGSASDQLSLSRQYVESPRTKAALARSEASKLRQARERARERETETERERERERERLPWSPEATAVDRRESLLIDLFPSMPPRSSSASQLSTVAPNHFDDLVAAR